jgi:hypothetical protein
MNLKFNMNGWGKKEREKERERERHAHWKQFWFLIWI